MSDCVNFKHPLDEGLEVGLNELVAVLHAAPREVHAES
jgi:hypothetical protein